MAQNPDLIPVDGGPSLRDLELALTDGVMGIRSVRFHFSDMVDPVTKADKSMDMQVQGLHRLGADFDRWEVRGVAETPQGRRAVVVEYNTKTRMGGVGVYSDPQSKEVCRTEVVKNGDEPRMPSL